MERIAMSNLITIEDENAFVSIDTIVEFSGNTEKSVKELIRDNGDALSDFAESAVSNGTLLKGESGKQIEWSKVKLNEPQAYYILTLLRNTPTITEFKKNLIKQFFALRNKYEADKAVLISEEMKRLTLEAKKCRVYDDGFTSCRGLVQNIPNIEHSERSIKENLYKKGYIRPVYKKVQTWELTENGAKSGVMKYDSHGTVVYDMKKIMNTLEEIRTQSRLPIPNSMKIHVYNGFNGEFHCTFESLRDAERTLGVAGISGILNGSRGNNKKHIRGMCFRTGDVAPESIEPLAGEDLKKIFRDINVFDNNGVFIGRYKTGKLAGEAGGNGVTQVGRLLRSGKSNQKGFTYSYAELEF